MAPNIPKTPKAKTYTTKGVAARANTRNDPTLGGLIRAPFTGRLAEQTKELRQVPGIKAMERARGENPDTATVVANLRRGMYAPMAPQTLNPPSLGNLGSSGGGGRGYGGGGGGGGGGGAAIAQSQLDYLLSMLNSQSFRPQDINFDPQRESVRAASAQDQGAINTSYNDLDAWLGANQSNPYGDVRVQAAQAAPDQNRFLQSQGVAAPAAMQGNPEDTGYGSFQNVLNLLNARAGLSNQSERLQSQQGRRFAGEGISALDNAMLANIGSQEQAARLAENQRVQQQRQQVLMQLAELIGAGAKAPDLSALGL